MARSSSSSKKSMNLTLPKLKVSLPVSKVAVGLDIGTSAVRAAELDVSKAHPTLLTYGQVGLPPGSLVDGEIRDTTAVGEAIAKLWKNGQFSSNSVIVGIAGLRAITRELDLPYVPDAEVDSAVRFQSEEVIPFPPDQTILSSQVLADYTSPEGAKMRRVLVAAAHTELVHGVIASVEGAGLTVEGVDLVSSALVRAIGDHQPTDQPEAIVSVGAGLTVVVVHQEGRPQFVRTIGSGGNATTAALSGALDLPLTDAEGMKRRLAEQGRQMVSGERAVQQSMNELVGEIRNSIQYFASLPGRLPVSRIVISGGGSELHGLSELLEAQVHLPVLRVSPLDRLDTSKLALTDQHKDQVTPVLATPIGLALPEPDKAVKKFNLLPPEVAKRSQMKHLQHRVLVGASVAVLALLGFGGWKFLQVHNAQSNVATVQAEIDSLNAQVPKFDLVVAANQAYTAGQQRRDSVLQTAVDWPVALRTLIDATPPGAQVETFDGSSNTSATGGSSTTPGATTVSNSTTSAAIGTVALGVTGPGPSLSISEAWINAIASSKLFANPLQGATQVNADSTISFPFSVSVTPTASLDKNGSLK